LLPLVWYRKRNARFPYDARGGCVGTRVTRRSDRRVGVERPPLDHHHQHEWQERQHESQGSEHSTGPRLHLANIRAGVRLARWEYAVFVNNVTDERALLALDRERGTRARVGYLTNQPRTFGARVGFTY